MKQSFSFVPRSVARKPTTASDKKRSTVSTVLRQAAAQSTAGKDADTTCLESEHIVIGKDTVTPKSQTIDSENLRTSLNKDSENEQHRIQQSNRDSTGLSSDEFNNKKITSTAKPSNENSNKSASKSLDTGMAKEQSSGFSFSAFVENVCKYNNFDISGKENLPDPQIPSTSNKLPVSESDRSQVTETSRCVSTFAETVYSQNNLPLTDVGPLSPRRKVANFVRQTTPLYVPNQPILDTAKPRETGTPMGRPSSVSSSKQSPSFTQVTEPAVKKFKNDVAFRNPESAFHSPRVWESTKYGKKYLRQPWTQKGLNFSVMSYNILAQNLLEDNMYLYGGCDHDVLDWKYRKKQLMAELTHHKPDVICLQEVHTQAYEDFFKPQFQRMGYDSAYIKRSGDKHDGCATFVNSSKFFLEQSIPVEYFRTPSGGILDRDNVALIVKLKPKSPHVPSQRRVFVSNTHLLFNPRRGDIKLAQIMVLLAELDKCGFQHGSRSDLYHPVILCGDFNSEPHSELYKLLTMGRLQYEGLLCRMISGQQEGLYRGNNTQLARGFMPKTVGISDTCQYLDVLKSRNDRFLIGEEEEVEMTAAQGTGLLSHEFNLVSTYQHTIGRLNHRHSEVTTYHNRASCTVDYIFYGVRCKDVRFWHGEVEMRGIQDGPLHLVSRYGLLADHELQKMGGLPNERLSSDHLSLLTNFLLT